MSWVKIQINKQVTASMASRPLTRSAYHKWSFQLVWRSQIFNSGAIFRIHLPAATNIQPKQAV